MYSYHVVVIKMVAYKMESCIRGYHVYKDLWDASIGEDILMIKIDMLWLYSRIKLLSAIFQERYLKFVLCFSKGWCYNLYTYRKEIFFIPAAEYIRCNFQYRISSNVIVFLIFKFCIAATHTKLF